MVVFWWRFGSGLVVAIFAPGSSPLRRLRRPARRRAGVEPGLVFFVFTDKPDGLVGPVIRHRDPLGQDGGAVAKGRIEMVLLEMF